jgi:hypothetical protein
LAKNKFDQIGFIPVTYISIILSNIKKFENIKNIENEKIKIKEISDPNIIKKDKFVDNVKNNVIKDENKVRFRSNTVNSNNGIQNKNININDDLQKVLDKINKNKKI